jgi:hypothetical protein
MKRELAIAAALFAVASVLLTLPLAQHPTRTLPSDLQDTLLNTWIIAWDADRLRHGLRGVWDAPIFFPYHTTLAFSENLFGLAFLVAPVYWLTGNAVLTYNAAFLFSFVLAGVGMYALVRVLTDSRAAAAIAAAYYAFCPFRMAQAQLAHIQMLATGWMPIVLWALHEYFFTVKRQWLALFVAAFCLQALSNTYLAYFIAVPVVVVAIDGLIAAGHKPALTARLLELTAAALAVLVALAPIALQYYRVRVDYQQVRSLGEIQEGGADVRAYFVATSGLWRKWLSLPQPIFAQTEKELFPGLVAPLLAAVAIASAGWRRRANGRSAKVSPSAQATERNDRSAKALAERGRWIALYSLIAVAGLVLSFGPLVRIWGVVLTAHGPYDWLQKIVPGMTGMRVPSRFTTVFVMALAALAGFGASFVLARLKPQWRPVVVVLLVLGVVADGWAVPIPTVRYGPNGRPEDRAAAEWLRSQPPGAVLHLPIVTNNWQELHHQYATLFHGHPIVNGFSGWETPLQDFLRRPWTPMYDYDRFGATVRMLRSLGVRYIVVHPGDYNITQQENREMERTVAGVRASGQIAIEQRLLGLYAFALEPWTQAAAPADDALEAIAPGDMTLTASHAPDRVALLVDRDRDTRWIGVQDGSSSISIDMERPCSVARIQLELATRSLTDYPRELQIDSVNPLGESRTLYHAIPYPELAAAFVRDPAYPVMTIDLPPNQSARLVIREVGTQPAWWSVHELGLWRRR